MLETLIGAGLSGLGSLLGGLGAKDSAEEQQARQEAYDAAARKRVTEVTEKYRLNVPKWLVEDAEKAGFNPVTWLNGGALGWYGTQLTGLVSSYGQATQAINIPSAMSAIGGAISSFGGAFMQGTQFDRKMDLAEASFGMQQQMYADSIAGGRYGAAHPLAASMSAPGHSAGGAMRSGGAELSSWDRGYGPQINRGPSDKAAPMKIVDDLDPEVHLPSADAVSREYGDIAEWVYGIGKLSADVYHTTTGRSAVRDMRAAGAYVGGAWNDLTAPFGNTKLERAIKPFFSNPGNVPPIGMGM